MVLEGGSPSLWSQHKVQHLPFHLSSPVNLKMLPDIRMMVNSWHRVAVSPVREGGKGHSVDGGSVLSPP